MKGVWGIRTTFQEMNSLDWLSNMAIRLERLCAGRPDFIIANSGSGRRNAANRGYPMRKLSTVYNGTHTGVFRKDKEAGRIFRREIGIRDDEILIGIVGRLHPVKGHPEFLRAAVLLSGERADLRFACIGGGGPEAYVRE